MERASTSSSIYIHKCRHHFFSVASAAALYFLLFFFSMSSLYVKNDNAAVIKTAVAAVHLSSDGEMDCVSTLFSL